MRRRSSRNKMSGRAKLSCSRQTLPYRTTGRRSPRVFWHGRELRHEDILLKTANFYREQGIHVKTRTSVINLDLRRRILHCEPAGDIGFEKLLITTGSEVRRLDLPGADLKGLYYLRVLRDAQALRRQVQKAAVRS